MTIYDEVRPILRKALAEGKLVHAGWEVLASILPAEAGYAQRRDMRIAFFAGCRYGIDSIMGFTDPGAETTDNDMRRMDAMWKELERFEEELREWAKRR